MIVVGVPKQQVVALTAPERVTTIGALQEVISKLAFQDVPAGTAERNGLEVGDALSFTPLNGA